MTRPTLHELNQRLFADLLPATHGAEAQAAAAAAPAAPAKKGGKKAAAAAPAQAAADQAAAAQYTDEQLEILKAAGIEDAAADPQTVAAILGLPFSE